MGARGEREAFSTVEVRVSVICTARDAEGTLARTVQSVLEQDMAEWEMIIVDDGSTDRTLEIARAFAAGDGRIRIVATPGIGRGRALNLAVAHARANLIANIDADDESHLTRLRYQLEAMGRYSVFAIICSDWVRVEGAAPPTWPEFDASAGFVVADVTKALAISNPVCHSSAIMRKEAIVGLGGYSEGRRFVFDYDLWVRAAAAGLRLGRIPLPLVAKRIHPNQAYLHAARARYLLASTAVQLRAMRTLRVGRRYLPLVVLRFLWGIMPLRVRLVLSNAGARLSQAGQWRVR
jgi:glycosyltransferase involved in cell wall biosynthesis